MQRRLDFRIIFQSDNSANPLKVVASSFSLDNPPFSYAISDNSLTKSSFHRPLKSQKQSFNQQTKRTKLNLRFNLSKTKVISTCLKSNAKSWSQLEEEKICSRFKAEKNVSKCISTLWRLLFYVMFVNQNINIQIKKHKTGALLFTVLAPREYFTIIYCNAILISFLAGLIPSWIVTGYWSWIGGLCSSATHRECCWETSVPSSMDLYTAQKLERADDWWHIGYNAL